VTPVSIGRVLEPGAVVGDYEVSRPLDGASYLASQNGRTVALQTAGQPSFRRAGGGLDHPAIVTVYDVFSYRGESYVAREHVPGRSLRGWIGRTSAAQATGALEATLSALAHAHAQGVVHGDVKPENLLVTETGELKLSGFTGQGDAASDVQAVRGLARELLVTPPAEIAAWLERLPPDARRARDGLKEAAERAFGPGWREPLLERDPTGEFLTYEFKAPSRPPTSESAELRALDAVLPPAETEHLERPAARTAVQPRVEPPPSQTSYSVYARGSRAPAIAVVVAVVVVVILVLLLT
jgi:serine/threonine protein kinase